MSEWIPTSERQPDEVGEYLVTISDELDTGWRMVMVLTYDQAYDRKFDKYTPAPCWRFAMPRAYLIGDVIYDNVKAWMPFPEPYKGDLI